MARKQRRIPRVQPHIGPNINPDPHDIAGRSTDDERPSFRFGHSDPSKYCLHEWQASEIKALVETFKRLEQRTWRQIKATGGQGDASGGLGYKPIDRKMLPALPADVPPDATISEIRVTQKMRLFGHRSEAMFYLVWFDREHGILSD